MIVCRLELRPDPTGEAYSAHSDRIDGSGDVRNRKGEEERRELMDGKGKRKGRKGRKGKERGRRKE